MHIVLTYNLAVEVVLFDHDSIDCLVIPEGKEAEASRSASSTITHNCAFSDFAKLGKVVAKRLYNLVSSIRSTLQLNKLTISCLPI